MRLELLPAEPLLPGERMLTATDENESVFEQRDAGKRRILRALHVDAELRLATQHGGGDIGRGMIENPDAIVGVERGITLYDSRQVLHANGGHARDGYVTAQRLAGLAYLDQGHREIDERPPRLRSRINSFYFNSLAP